MCDTHIPLLPKFLSPTDLTGLVPPITCRLMDAEEAAGLPSVTLKSQIKVLEWLLSLPF